MYRYFKVVPPVFIDGLLYILIAVLAFSQAYFGGDEAAKFISPAFKFWLNGILGMSLAAVGALKMFRSSTYAEHRQVKEANDERQQMLQNTGP